MKEHLSVANWTAYICILRHKMRSWKSTKHSILVGILTRTTPPSAEVSHLIPPPRIKLSDDERHLTDQQSRSRCENLSIKLVLIQSGQEPNGHDYHDQRLPSLPHHHRSRLMVSGQMRQWARCFNLGKWPGNGLDDAAAREESRS